MNKDDALMAARVAFYCGLGWFIGAMLLAALR
jgi:hypothetical protein